ncbi:MAG: protein-glutamate O-methyltransferase CheR [Pseudodesulfovibrio sp.]|uniref:protein-glutamate O-methyltransferase n=2 Tax=Pseudodesulfovibrio aespoeensis TaxID=182210 RepID=E6VZQ6_PSEA9|nr:MULTISPECIES: protein-glutamate O-methyltransferase CheR [Pseudodesulfovibrio]MBU4192173.1 protein-glutamate O-methyltransferase CheR [Pseudomonadota bacterium]ADU62884.1 Protein-glutamate O-methyltransferase [Pseudodesulfovibrio aespoeensis Aspo-2]MBU4244397.1 protein-glutamate O-methyltransferase CheR [Pseudomonadota bacterium]MBU4379028.1 protein-glutamate O-methyltransferase CheR [Pseudomonadota bacterium]MBU4475009.1 protein-glutamate O-methyltransferase CheR [Pseudomonadota bacterium]
MSSLFSKTISLGKELKITDQEFGNLRDFIYEQCGIYIADNRKYLLENRLGNRLKKLNLRNFDEYYNFLRYDAARNAELKKLFEVITTNETSFYRNPPQLQVFQEKVLTEVVEAAKSGGRKLRIWSAGCSTGEEPYTIAMIIHALLQADIANWDIRITANDLSERVLESARKGVYNDYTLRTTPKEIAQRYFDLNDGVNTVRPEVKKLVSFGQINLRDRAQIKRVERSQIVFCRNVIIYFDDAMKKQVISSFYDNLLPGGYLIIGHSESLHNITRAFKPIHFPGAIIYKKEE